MLDLHISYGAAVPAPLDASAGIRGLAWFERLIRALDRAEIEFAVDRLIARLDSEDGDPDLEPEEDCEHDGAEPEEWRAGRLRALPVYDLDQSKGPTNERDIQRRYIEYMRSEH